MTRFLTSQLDQRKKLGNYRKLCLMPNLIDFASNDYLGLARSFDLATATDNEWKTQKCSLGSTGSRLLTGNSRYIEELEDKIAAFHGYEAGLLFSCGYMANVGLLSAIASAHDAIFFDIQVHASIHDGIRLSRASAFPFRHNDLEHLEKRLQNNLGKRHRFICIESIYSTDGSKAPLREISQLLKKYEAHLIVDEAHAVGVFGPKGQGLVAEEGLIHEVFAQVTTFGKALGAYGAIVLGNKTVKETLINFARSYIYTTALPFHTLAMIQCSYMHFPKMQPERLHIKNLISHFRKGYPNASETHIQPIKIPGNHAAQQKAKQLAEKGFDVRALLSPTVQKDHEVLRICLHAFNTEKQISDLKKYLEVSYG